MFIKHFNKRTDEFFCFWIQDFLPKDCLIVKTKTGREKGIVESVDYNKCLIFYKNAEQRVKSVSIEDIVMLKGPTKLWL